jgi:hypothetical protein
VEVLLDTDYVDVSSEAAYVRVKDNLKLMQRIKVGVFSSNRRVVIAV